MGKSNRFRVTKKVKFHHLNAHINLELGYQLRGDRCPLPKPEPPVGEVGYYECSNNNEWVWIPSA